MQTKPKLRFKDKNGNAYPEWEENLLGDIGELRNGIAKGSEFFGHGHKFINLQDVFGKDCLYNDDYDLVETSEKERQLNDLKKGDVIFVRSSVKPSGVGLPSVVMEDLKDTVFSGFLIRFREHKLCLNLLYKRYCFIVDSFRREVLKRSSSSANTNINQDNLANIKLKIPCLEEQEKIAEFLSKVDELINECEGEVKDLEEQKKGLMQKIFSQQIRFKDSNNNPYPDWEEHCINEFIISLKSGLSRELQNEDIGIPVIRANNTYNGIVGGNDIKYWYKKDPKGANIDNYILDDGDILINFINSLPRMGETAIYTNFLNRPCIYTTNLLRLKLNNKLNYKYFFYYTKTSEYINYIKAITKPAVNQASFTTVDFKNLKLLLPCLEEQEKIAKVLSKMNELIEEKKALLSDWQQFKKGLLQQMFV